MASRTLDFSTASEAKRKASGESLMPCLSRVQLEEMGVRVDSFPALKMSPPEACVAFDEIIPQATSRFDFNTQTLHLSFPQAAMMMTARGTVDPSRWDEGIPALLLDYSFSGSNGRNEGTGSSSDSTSDSYYLNLRSGLNVGPWRLRNNSIWNRTDGKNQWDNVGTSLNRAIIPLKSQITLGDTATPGEIFDSVQMRGALLASDDEMLPDSQRGFAPVVRGIAKSNAEVSIEQNGYVIYRTFVQPGAFEINDLYATSGSGDLTVIIKEADGSEQRFIQPFSAVAIFQREGYLKYSLAAGEYRAGNYDSDKPHFGQFTAMYGLPWGMTAYGGALLSADYSALALGLGKTSVPLAQYRWMSLRRKVSYATMKKRKASLIASSIRKVLRVALTCVCWATNTQPAATTPSRKQLMFAVTPTVITAVITSAARYRAILPSNWETTARFISI